MNLTAIAFGAGHKYIDQRMPDVQAAADRVPGLFQRIGTERPYVETMFARGYSYTCYRGCIIVVGKVAPHFDDAGENMVRIYMLVTEAHFGCGSGWTAWQLTTATNPISRDEAKWFVDRLIDQHQRYEFQMDLSKDLPTWSKGKPSKSSAKKPKRTSIASKRRGT